jgi:hypothetical protein
LEDSSVLSAVLSAVDSVVESVVDAVVVSLVVFRFLPFGLVWFVVFVGVSGGSRLGIGHSATGALRSIACSRGAYFSFAFGGGVIEVCQSDVSDVCVFLFSRVGRVVGVLVGMARLGGSMK